MATVNVSLISDLAAGTVTTSSQFLIENGGSFESAAGSDIISDLGSDFVNGLPTQGAVLSIQRDPAGASDLAVSATTWTDIGWSAGVIVSDSMWAGGASITCPQKYYLASGMIKVTDLDSAATADIKFRLYDSGNAATFATWVVQKPKDFAAFYCQLTAKMFAPTALAAYKLQIYCSEACTVPYDTGEDTWLSLVKLGAV